MFSDGDFSFLLTLGSMVRMFAFMILAYFLFAKKSVTRVSFKFLQCYVCVFIFRLSSILNYEGYLPFDRSGDFIYQAFEVLSLVASIGCVFLVVGPYKHTYEKTNDKFGSWHIPSEFGAIYILKYQRPSCLGLSPFTEQQHADGRCVDLGVVLGVGCHLATNCNVASNGVGRMDFACSCIIRFGRFFQLVFWISSYHELNDKFNSSPGGNMWSLCCSIQVLQLLLMGDYFYFT